jgi:hypothetical protein
MVTFLFWNVGGKAIQQLVAAAALSVEADCVVLAECSLNPSQVIESLNQLAPDYQYAFGECESLMFFAKFDPRFLVPKFETPRITIRHLRLPARKDILIAAAHLPSKLYFSEASLVQECCVLARYVESEEQAVGHKRTVLFGDFNVNPFESGVVGAGGLHAVSTRSVAGRGSRIVQNRLHDFFYNPMWSHFGDSGDNPPGTYYYDRAEPVNYFWNMYDQVLVRPELLDGFSTGSLRILTTAGPRALLDLHGHPDKASASDHLPIVFGLEF